MKDDKAPENHMATPPENASEKLPDAPGIAPETEEVYPCPDGFDPVRWAKWRKPNQKHYLDVIKKSKMGGHK